MYVVVVPSPVNSYASIVSDAGTLVNPLPSPMKEPVNEPVKSFWAFKNALIKILDDVGGASTNVTDPV